MRSRKRVGRLIIVVGILVLMAIIMPTGFWWFVLGIVLIVIGIRVCLAAR